MITRLLASGARLYVAAIALALAYEMISGSRPNQIQTLWIYSVPQSPSSFSPRFTPRLGGIKAVIWTDLIQASIMIGQRANCAWLALLRQFPAAGMKSCNATAHFEISDFITTGLDPAKTWLGQNRRACSRPSTRSFAGLIGATFITMATHGTDQDMVQRMLTAPDIRRSRRSLILLRARRHPDRAHVSQHWTIALDLLSGSSRSNSAQNSERNILPLYSLSNASGHSRIAPGRNLRHRHGLAQHGAQRTRHEFHARLVRALHQSRRDGRTKLARRAMGDCVVLNSDDQSLHRQRLSRHRASRSANHPNRAWDLRLHLRLAPGCISLRNAHQDDAATIVATSSP